MQISNEERWQELVAEAKKLGYTVLIVEWVECAECPGILGMAEGAIIYKTKRIRIKRDLPLSKKILTLEHELEHARSPHDGERIDREYWQRRTKSS